MNEVILGGLVVVFDIAQFLPQARRALRLRGQQAALRGLSLWTWTVASAQAILWVIYGFATDRLPIAVPNVVIAPICVLVLTLAVRSHRAHALVTAGALRSGPDRPRG
jgi:uncharacterized protein with PQ loop repeat